ncbi:c-type cytochrome [Chitinophaga sancti]|uniref:Cytochrome c n=1 Tax=Chitinophaga sancti TaxID=1004 RepID=A0A1K1S078_9BACT|nr:cytochrome c [Chitinophaga sancti]WQD59791.1 cytochrome c [Chitinophaga sancti]WQG88078.1 cytochrome c [Chitinophaga sancti]SFW77718.1 Cytochrome c, mono-and diheme variants [Chitinophaga sancti]
MNKYLYTAVLLAIAVACSNNSKPPKEDSTSSVVEDNSLSGSTSSSSYDSLRGSGKFKNVELSPTLDQKMIAAGKSVYEVKCAACHKLTTEKLVGPGWKGVTTRKSPEWIMNFVTNTDEMIDKDPRAQAMLAVCMVRMPNQHLSDEETRNVLEFMRNNDSSK